MKPTFAFFLAFAVVGDVLEVLAGLSDAQMGPRFYERLFLDDVCHSQIMGTCPSWLCSHYFFDNNRGILLCARVFIDGPQGDACRI